jgi:GAF domain-containing protein
LAAAPNPLYAKVLGRAAQILGGTAALRHELGVRAAELEDWLRGTAKPPDAIFLRAVDIVSGKHAQLLRRSVERKLASEEKVRLSLEALARLRGPLPTRLEAALDASLAATGATKANLQISERNALILAAQRGFGDLFTRFFARVSVDARSACGLARMEAKRVVVADIARSTAFADDPARDLVLAEGIAAVQCTPLMATDGRVLGLLSTHYPQPGEPSAADLAAIDAIAPRAAAWLERQAR